MPPLSQFANSLLGDIHAVHAHAAPTSKTPVQQSAMPSSVEPSKTASASVSFWDAYGYGGGESKDDHAEGEDVGGGRASSRSSPSNMPSNYEPIVRSVRVEGGGTVSRSPSHASRRGEAAESLSNYVVRIM